MKFSHALLVLVASMMIINSSCSKVNTDQDVVLFDLYPYDFIPYPFDFYYSYCVYPYGPVCYAPNYYYYIWRKNPSKFEEIKLRLDKEEGIKGDIKSNLTTELKAIKKELFGDELKSIAELKQNAYSAESLSKQLQLNRMRELEKFIAERENSTN